MKSTAELVGDALSQMNVLMRGELSLMRAELAENAERAAVALGLLAGAAILALTALQVLAGAVVAGLAELGLGPGWAALIVGSVIALIGFAMAVKGLNDLKASSLAPSRTIENVKRDAAKLKEAANGQ